MLKLPDDIVSDMPLPELGTGIWIGIAIGLLGIAFWIVGLLVFDYLVDRVQRDRSNVEE